VCGSWAGAAVVGATVVTAAVFTVAALTVTVTVAVSQNTAVGSCWTAAGLTPAAGGSCVVVVVVVGAGNFEQSR
jgi:hypothetical protein